MANIRTCLFVLNMWLLRSICAQTIFLISSEIVIEFEKHSNCKKKKRSYAFCFTSASLKHHNINKELSTHCMQFLSEIIIASVITTCKTCSLLKPLSLVPSDASKISCLVIEFDSAFILPIRNWKAVASRAPSCEHPSPRPNDQTAQKSIIITTARPIVGSLFTKLDCMYPPSAEKQSI